MPKTNGQLSVKVSVRVLKELDQVLAELRRVEIGWLFNVEDRSGPKHPIREVTRQCDAASQAMSVMLVPDKFGLTLSDIPFRCRFFRPCLSLLNQNP